MLTSSLAGGIDPGETPIQAAVRETEEEAGVKGNVVCQLGTYIDEPHRLVTHIYLMLVNEELR